MAPMFSEDDEVLERLALAQRTEAIRRLSDPSIQNIYNDT